MAGSGFDIKRAPLESILIPAKEDDPVLPSTIEKQRKQAKQNEQKYCKDLTGRINQTPLEELQSCWFAYSLHWAGKLAVQAFSDSKEIKSVCDQLEALGSKTKTLSGLSKPEKKQFEDKLKQNEQQLKAASVTKENVQMVLALGRLMLASFLSTKKQPNKDSFSLSLVVNVSKARTSLELVDILGYSKRIAIDLLSKASQYERESVEAIKTQLDELGEQDLARQIVLPSVSLSVHSGSSAENHGEKKAENYEEKKDEEEKNKEEVLLSTAPPLPLTKSFSTGDLATLMGKKRSILKKKIIKTRKSLKNENFLIIQKS